MRIRGLQAMVAAVLSALLAGQPLFGLASGTKPGVAVSAPELRDQQRVLHALNRLTFGPRPGDVARVQAMGLNAWFEQQLNPASIDDSKLKTRLAQFPAMQMNAAELTRRYPGPQMIKKMAAGELPLPSDPVLRAICTDQIAFYRIRQAKKAGDDDAVKKGAAALLGDDGVKQDEPMQAAEMAGSAPHADDVGATFSKDEAQAILRLAPADRMRVLLGMPAERLVSLRASLSGRDRLELIQGLTPSERETLLALAGSLQMIGAETLQSRMLRDVYSERQLEAVMTDFWLNHFNVYMKKSQLEPYEIPAYERETIRPRALGKFEDLLVATAESPAMLTYLDNWRSVGPDSQAATNAKMRQNKKASEGLNENYGRELMELHTLGVGGGYTQTDVTQVAKVFTGWTIATPYQGGGFTFEERRHEPGAKTVLGVKIKEDGQKEGLEVLHMLATSPATARFISTKLAVRFVSDDPPAPLVQKMTKSFLASNGDIKTVLRTMFQAPEFWSPAVYRAKVKTPLEFVVSAARASGVDVVHAQVLVQSLDKLGMPLYGMQTPNGYSWKQDGWVSTGALVSRMNFALAMSGGKLPGVTTEWSSLLGSAMPVGYSGDGAAAIKEKRLEAVLLSQPVSERTRSTVLAQSSNAEVAGQAALAFDLSPSKNGNSQDRRADANGTDDAQAGIIAGLLLGSPEFQRR